ncbi:MAG: SelB C-terminal domain-containing protein, partial [Pseudomonadales bacterium]|nr:SelB C-terminal domain-containing protein [Pseudomonadales bacterium]
SPSPLEKFLRKLTKARLLVNPIPRRFFLPHAYAALRQDAVTLHEREGPFTVAAFRDESGVGRNLAVEILEHFDRSGITQRAGDVRRVRQPDPNNKG